MTTGYVLAGPVCDGAPPLPASTTDESPPGIQIGFAGHEIDQAELRMWAALEQPGGAIVVV